MEQSEPCTALQGLSVATYSGDSATATSPAAPAMRWLGVFRRPLGLNSPTGMSHRLSECDCGGDDTSTFDIEWDRCILWDGLSA